MVPECSLLLLIPPMLLLLLGSWKKAGVKLGGRDFRTRQTKTDLQKVKRL